MSREIKFRAWNDDHMLYPDDDDTDYVWGYGQAGISVEYFDSAQAKIVNGEIVEFEGYVDLNVIFEQFTGLHDKNGKEIYEGDIVRVKKERNGMKFDSTRNVTIPYVYWLDAKARSGDTWEVIGNIHENPELMEAGE